MSKALSIIAFLLLAIAPGLWAQERQVATYSGVSGSLGPQWLAVDRHLFEKYGAKIDWVLMTGAVRGMQALLSGSSDYYTGDPVGPITASLQGGDIVIVGNMINRIAGSILARKEIREPTDLRGKKIGIASFGGATELSVILSLKKWNLPPDAVSLIQSGLPQDRLSAVMKGALDATPLTPPHSIEAARRGLNVLIDFKDIEAFPGRVIAVRRSFLEKNRDTVKRFLKAYSEAVYQFSNDKKLGIATFAKWLKEKNVQINEETYEFYRDLLSFPPRAVRGEGLRVGIQLIAQRLGRGNTNLNIERFFDERLLDELEKEGFFSLIAK